MVKRLPLMGNATVIILVASALISPALGNHYILPCGEQCDPIPSVPSYAYIGDSLSGNVTVIETTANAVVARMDLGSPARTVVVSPDGKRAYAANADNVVVIDTESFQSIGTIEYQSAQENFPPGAGIAINPTGTRLYVTDQRRAGVVVIDTATYMFAKVFTGIHAFNITVSPDGTRVYATGFYDDMVSVIDGVTDTLITNIPINNPFVSPPISAGDFSAGTAGLVVNPSGTRLYVANVFLFDQAHANSPMYIVVIDTATNTVLAYVPTGPTQNFGIAMNPAGTRVYTSNGAVIDTASNTVIGTIPSSTRGLAINPPGTRIYLPQETPPSVLVVDTETNAVVTTILMEGSPYAYSQFIGPMGRPAPGAAIVAP